MRALALAVSALAARVVAFNFNPLQRDLNRGDHRLLWNALLNWNAMAGAP